jgi:hypothetical protein
MRQWSKHFVSAAPLWLLILMTAGSRWGGVGEVPVARDEAAFPLQHCHCRCAATRQSDPLPRSSPFGVFMLFFNRRVEELEGELREVHRDLALHVEQGAALKVQRFSCTPTCLLSSHDNDLHLGSHPKPSLPTSSCGAERGAQGACPP